MLAISELSLATKALAVVIPPFAMNMRSVIDSIGTDIEPVKSLSNATALNSHSHESHQQTQQQYKQNLPPAKHIDRFV